MTLDMFQEIHCPENEVQVDAKRANHDDDPSPSYVSSVEGEILHHQSLTSRCSPAPEAVLFDLMSEVGRERQISKLRPAVRNALREAIAVVSSHKFAAYGRALSGSAPGAESLAHGWLAKMPCLAAAIAQLNVVGIENEYIPLILTEGSQKSRRMAAKLLEREAAIEPKRLRRETRLKASVEKKLLKEQRATKKRIAAKLSDTGSLFPV